MYDVIIIGAGVTGCAIARELSRYEVNACVLEKADDVCEGTSKANSAIIHAGFDADVGSLMAKTNVLGNEMMEDLCKDLDVPFRRNGSMVVCTDINSMDGIRELYERGVANNVKGLRILSREEALEKEPNLSKDVQGALFAPTGGIVCPFKLTIALAENANVNGVEFRLNTKVMNIEKMEDGTFKILTNNGEYLSRYIVNAAGVYADKIHNMVSEDKMNIIERKGEYLLLDKEVGDFVNSTIFAQPTKMGKGVLVTPTVHGNLLVGPTATDIDDKDGVNTTAAGINEVILKSAVQVDNLPLRKVITSFAGLRAHLEQHDFVIEEVKDVPHFIDVAGIESPGLSASPAIGCMVADMLCDSMELTKKKDFVAKRKDIVDPNKLSIEERNELIKKNPAYGNIICRCESVSEGEILDAIHRPLGAKSLDGVKRRTRAGMGRCQMGFCSPRTMEILHRELGLSYEEITKSGGRSNIVMERTKNQRGGEQ